MDSTLLTDLIVLLLSVMPRVSVNLIQSLILAILLNFLGWFIQNGQYDGYFWSLLFFLTCFHPDILALIMLKAKERHKNYLQRHNDKAIFLILLFQGPSGLEKSSGN